MGNLISVLVHCKERGSELILGDHSHIFLHEQGGSAVLGGVHSRTIPNELDGTLDLTKVEAAIRSGDIHEPVTRLICIENTQNECGGRVLSVEYMDKMGALAAKHGLKFHVDGARIANAAAALGVPTARLIQSADSVTMCLSKALAAPIGSVIAGSSSFIAQARILRKMVGGGMRQVGVVAAAGLVALRDMVDRLQEDHKNAKQLSSRLASVPGITVTSVVESNIFFLRLDPNCFDLPNLQQKLKEKGILILPASASGRLRIVTHYQVTASDLEKIVTSLKELSSHA